MLIINIFYSFDKIIIRLTLSKFLKILKKIDPFYQLQETKRINKKLREQEKSVNMEYNELKKKKKKVLYNY